MEVDTVIGVYDWERGIRQCLRLDLTLGWDNRPAAAGDDLALALDYAALSERVQEFARESHFQLVETFAERLAEVLMGERGIPLAAHPRDQTRRRCRRPVALAWRSNADVADPGLPRPRQQCRA